ncbi:MAG TPA: nicotinate phosphoribosyltransferase [Acidimicrobiales bacterium]
MKAQESLYTDRYELSMLDGALTSGVINAKATFEVFTRSLANGYRYGVVGGTGRLLESLAAFSFNDETISWLLAERVVSVELATFLASYRFEGSVYGYREGEVFTALSPILRIEGRFCDLVLETLALSILNYDSGVATKAARVVTAAQGHRLIEMGSRRTNEVAAVAAARAAYVAGFDATSNLAAGMNYGVPTAGTAAHAFILAHRSEREAFEAQVAAQGPGTTLLVDTFDTEAGTELALDVAGPELGAIRIDSGDLADSSRRCRKLLDQRGATKVKITVTGDLDEFKIAELLANDAPVDTFGVGTKLVTGYMPPGFVFKLVAIEDGTTMRPVAKRSIGKLSSGSAKDAYRLYENGVAVTELVIARDAGETAPSTQRRALSQALYERGAAVVDTSLETARETARAALNELPRRAFDLRPGDPALATTVVTGDTPRNPASDEERP